MRNFAPTTGEWNDAPAGLVLMPGRCDARDADGQGCAGFDHYPKPHQSTGLRAWLEDGENQFVIRCYDSDRADELEAMESPLFAKLGFAVVARQEVVRRGGLHVGWALVVGPLLAPSATIRLRVVCFARGASPIPRPALTGP